ncbi:hypothetical protein [Henriciella sp.]|uniref:hypothetical protein n=1 Tax=Henriciella sp. TaxID=1968823 RepID=UPI002631FBAD|nr:hypothetical protein [Henriciella sp.]
MANTDPVETYCRDGGRRERLFDCSCIGASAGDVRLAMAGQAAEKNARAIKSTEKAIDRLRDMATKRPEQAAAFESKIADQQQKLEQLRNPDPMSFGNGVVMKYYDTVPQCRRHDGAYQATFDSCMRVPNDGPGYCECVAGKIADTWVGRPVVSSSDLRSKEVSVRLACRQ